MPTGREIRGVLLNGSELLVNEARPTASVAHLIGRAVACETRVPDNHLYERWTRSTVIEATGCSGP